MLVAIPYRSRDRALFQAEGAKPGRNYYAEFVEKVPKRLRSVDLRLHQVQVL
jgi:hypothetical protein